MKYNFKVTHTPSVVSSHPFDEQSDMMERIVKTKSLIIEVYEKTKQTVAVSVRHEQSSFLVGYIPKGCEHLKFLEKWRSDVWDARQSKYCYYFKILKSQGWNEFKFYMKKLIDSLCLQEWSAHFGFATIDELDVTVWMNKDIRMRMCEPTILKEAAIVEM